MHIGGLAGISPAKLEFNLNTFKTDTIRCDTWTDESTQSLYECVSNCKRVTFNVACYESHRNFGQLHVHSENGSSDSISLNKSLCDLGVAMLDRNYKYGNCSISNLTFYFTLLFNIMLSDLILVTQVDAIKIMILISYALFLHVLYFVL